MVKNQIQATLPDKGIVSLIRPHPFLIDGTGDYSYFGSNLGIEVFPSNTNHGMKRVIQCGEYKCVNAATLTEIAKLARKNPDVTLLIPEMPENFEYRISTLQGDIMIPARMRLADIVNRTFIIEKIDEYVEKYNKSRKELAEEYRAEGNHERARSYLRDSPPECYETAMFLVQHNLMAALLQFLKIKECDHFLPLKNMQYLTKDFEFEISPFYVKTIYDRRQLKIQIGKSDEFVFDIVSTQLRKCEYLGPYELYNLEVKKVN